MDQNYNEKQATEYFEKQHEKAKEMLKDVDKTEEFLQKLEKKLKVVPIAGETLADVPLLISLVRLYIKKEYTEIPITSMVSIVAALIYVLSPIDIIPDVIPVAGYSDDALVVSACIALIKTDIEDYKVWREKNDMEITDFQNYDSIEKNAIDNNELFNAFFKGRDSVIKRTS